MEDEILSLEGKTLTNLRVVDLKQALEKRGLSKSGSKKDLVKRLKQQLELEKFCEGRRLAGDCDLKLELDAETEQNEFVQQYLAQQQKIYAEQKEVKRLVELEDIQKHCEKESVDPEKSDTSIRTDLSDTTVTVECADSQSNTHENLPSDRDDDDNDAECNSADSSTAPENPDSTSHVDAVTSDPEPTETRCEIISESSASPTMEQTQVSPVPYSLSDEPAKCLGTAKVKSKKSEEKLSSDSNCSEDSFQKNNLSNAHDSHSNNVSDSVEENARNSEKNNREQDSDKNTHLNSQKQKAHSQMSKDNNKVDEEKNDFDHEKPDDDREAVNISREHKKYSEASLHDSSDSTSSSSRGSFEDEVDEKSSKQKARKDSKTSETDEKSDAKYETDRRQEHSGKHVKSSSRSSSHERTQNKDANIEAPHKEENLTSEDNKSLITDQKSVGEKDSSKAAPPRQRIKIMRDRVKVDLPVIEQKESKEPHVVTKEQSSKEPPPSSPLETSEPQPIVKPKPSEVIPVKFTPRKISFLGRKSRQSDEVKSEEPTVKKSKWGNYVEATNKKSVSISTNTLKNLMPDFKLVNEPIPVQELESEETPNETIEPKIINLPSTSKTEPEVFENITSNKSEEVDKMPVDVEPVREPTPQGPVSKIIFIRNLVRPFTLLQLKDLLKKTGNMVEDEFWIDKIKSKCFVTYETEEEAVCTRSALHGTRWPHSNPKILSVEFSSQDELDFHRKPPASPKLPRHEQVLEVEIIETRAIVPADESRRRDRDRERKREKHRPMPPIREWDKDKLTQESPERDHAIKDSERSKSSEKKERKDSKRRSAEDTPAKLLDDLFQKTKAMPCIYWLPLTDEQVKQREEERRMRRMEREKRNQEQREQEETERRNRRARSGRRSHEKENRRSPSRSRSPISRRR